MEEKKCIVVFEGTYNEGMDGSPEQKEYSKRSADNAIKFGGFTLLSNHAFEQNLGDGEIPNFIVIVEYSSKEKIVQSLISDEYLSIIPIRNKVFKEIKILIVKN